MTYALSWAPLAFVFAVLTWPVWRRAWIFASNLPERVGGSRLPEIVREAKWPLTAVGSLGMLAYGIGAGGGIASTISGAIGTPAAQSVGAPNAPTVTATVYRDQGDSLWASGGTFVGSGSDTHDSTFLKIDSTGGGKAYHLDTIGAIERDSVGGNVAALDSGAVIDVVMKYKGASGGWSAPDTLSGVEMTGTPAAFFTQTWDYATRGDAWNDSPLTWFGASGSFSDTATDIRFDTVSPSPWGGTGAYMECTYPDENNASGCFDLRPTDVDTEQPLHVWVEVWIMWDSAWTTAGATASNPDHKTWLLTTDQNTRWSFKVDNDGNLSAGYEANFIGADGAGTACSSTTESFGNNYSTFLYNEQWNRFRIEYDIGASGGSTTGSMNANWRNDVATSGADSTVVYCDGNYDTTSRHAAGEYLQRFGVRNHNKGPTSPIWIAFGKVTVWTEDPGWTFDAF